MSGFKSQFTPFLTSLSTISLWLLLGALVIPAARATFQDDYQGYLKTYDAYRLAHSIYETTRNQYLQFKTLSAKNEALTAVKNMLSTRDDVLLGHISLLRTKNTDQTFTPQMDQYFNQLIEHKTKLPAVGSLDDAVSSSEEIEDQHIPMQNISRKVVGGVIADKVEAQKLQFVILENRAAALINTLKANNKDVTTQERWLLDAKNKRVLAEQKLLDVRTTINAFDGSDAASVGKDFNELQFKVFEANQYIREAVAYLHELSESIKYGNF